MKINRNIKCDLPCTDVNRDFILPEPDLEPEKVKIVMISEAPPINHDNYFYRSSSGTFFQTTKTAFRDAGIDIKSYRDLADMGIYLTTAIKCSKKDYLVSAVTIRQCSRLLEQEIERFKNVKVIMCMGDFAIKAVNFIYNSKYKTSPIKSGSTYKIRKENHSFNGVRFLPSYTQTGESFNIEKSKRQMIAEDIRKAMDCLK
jgi:uracil-DNA glycosylase